MLFLFFLLGAFAQTTPRDPWGVFRNTSCPAVVYKPPPPNKHKYNYASPDCSARIHSSSPLTQHASSLLHKSRDRYMLTPCKADQHWVVVELCDEIRVEGIEIAVWEYFSGIVREVKVSVGEDDDWTQVGTFIGKNVRGSQTYTLSQPSSFHRFIRLDFASFYGSEYYCPVSHLQVFGMNQMESFKREQKAPKEEPIEIIPEPLPQLDLFIPENITEEEPKRETSESIYAVMNRRLNALEGNSSVVLKLISQAMNRSELIAWRNKWETEERQKWEQERMRQEDRLGRVLSSLEQHRLALESERLEMQTQIRLLAGELSFERRRGLAQLFIMIIIIILGILSRTSTISELLKPLERKPSKKRKPFRSVSAADWPRPRKAGRNAHIHFRKSDWDET